jgi:hypothetical protein
VAAAGSSAVPEHDSPRCLPAGQMLHVTAPGNRNNVLSSTSMSQLLRSWHDTDTMSCL